MNKKTLLAITGVCSAVAALAVGCGPGAETSYRDFLMAIGTVFQIDGKTPVAGLEITNYNWVTTFTDGSTVSNSFKPATTLTTEATGKFTLNSNQLALQSGTQADECTTVCLDWAIGSEDVCTDWETDYQDVCTDWETDSDGNEYCANWESQGTDYCANWVSQPYDYCATYGQDCGWVYPARAAADVASAYSEIEYDGGAGPVTTQSAETTLPGAALKSTSTTDANNKTTVDTKWVQENTYVTSLVQVAAKTASSPTKLTLTVSPARLQITATRNAAHLSARKLKHEGAPHFGRTHGKASVVASAKLTTLSASQQAKIDAARVGCGAYPKSLK